MNGYTHSIFTCFIQHGYVHTPSTSLQEYSTVMLRNYYKANFSTGVLLLGEIHYQYPLYSASNTTATSSLSLWRSSSSSIYSYLSYFLYCPTHTPYTGSSWLPLLRGRRQLGASKTPLMVTTFCKLARTWNVLVNNLKLCIPSDFDGKTLWTCRKSIKLLPQPCMGVLWS